MKKLPPAVALTEAGHLNELVYLSEYIAGAKTVNDFYPLFVLVEE